MNLRQPVSKPLVDENPDIIVITDDLIDSNELTFIKLWN